MAVMATTAPSSVWALHCFGSYVDRREKYQDEDQQLHLASKLTCRVVEAESVLFVDRNRERRRVRHVSATVCFLKQGVESLKL